MRILITGGAGFIGANYARSCMARGLDVVVFDNLSRIGSRRNLDWLDSLGRFEFRQGDVRDADAVGGAMRGADAVVHLAGQVAVTTSVLDPRTDFEVNALGTLNVLEAARAQGTPPTVVYASTNKVYGAMDDVALVEGPTRHAFAGMDGIDEARPLDFHSPYGCSKGAGDQYVRDYARIYGVPTVVFRQSCIYGPRQFGVEDQGWLAHFVIAAQLGRPITIYGDGKQVRDLLYIDDLVRAYDLAIQSIDRAAGQIYNIGGGSRNAMSIWAECGALLETIAGRRIPVGYDGMRAGDQQVCVMRIAKAERDLGWVPLIGVDQGVRSLWDWVAENRALFTE